MIELYYAEDDPDIAGIVKAYLEQQGYNVTLYAALADVHKALEYHVPSVVLLDWSMPDGDGAELCRWIRSRWPALPIMLITVRGDSADIVSGFQNGADDYVVKPLQLEVLHSRIAALLRRSGDVTKQYLSCDGIIIDQHRRSVACRSQAVALSAAEYQLLLYLMQNKGRTLTRERILEQVWDVNGSYVNDNTLTVTMKRLRDKLHQPSCLKTVRSVGYRMEDTL